MGAEKLTLKIYDVDQNNLNTAKAKGGNATIGYGHLVHNGAIGSDQYDKNAIKNEKEFNGGISISKAFELLSSDLNSRLTTLNSQLKNRGFENGYKSSKKTRQ